MSSSSRRRRQPGSSRRRGGRGQQSNDINTHVNDTINDAGPSYVPHVPYHLEEPPNTSPLTCLVFVTVRVEDPADNSHLLESFLPYGPDKHFDVHSAAGQTVQECINRHEELMQIDGRIIPNAILIVDKVPIDSKGVLVVNHEPGLRSPDGVRANVARAQRLVWSFDSGRVMWLDARFDTSYVHPPPNYFVVYDIRPVHQRTVEQSLLDMRKLNEACARRSCTQQQGDEVVEKLTRTGFDDNNFFDLKYCPFTDLNYIAQFHQDTLASEVRQGRPTRSPYIFLVMNRDLEHNVMHMVLDLSNQRLRLRRSVQFAAEACYKLWTKQWSVQDVEAAGS